MKHPIRNKGRLAIRRTQGFVKKKPVKAVGLSLATGMIAGLALGYIINHR